MARNSAKNSAKFAHELSIRPAALGSYGTTASGNLVVDRYGYRLRSSRQHGIRYPLSFQVLAALQPVMDHSASDELILQGQNGLKFFVAFSLDRRTLASGSTDLTLNLWDVTGVHK